MEIDTKIENLLESLAFKLSHKLTEMFVFYKLYLRINTNYKLPEIFQLLGYSDAKRRQFASKLFKSWTKKETEEIEQIMKNQGTQMNAIIHLFQK